jgi:hypothetical protein
MKKATTLFLLIAMLFIGAHPILAMHFCGETLHSVAMTSRVDACCSNEEGEQTPGSKISPPGCCQTHEVHYSTDNFRVDTSGFTLNNYWLHTPSLWFCENISLHGISLLANRIDQTHFPPDGHPLQNSDILTYIRILRI